MDKQEHRVERMLEAIVAAEVAGDCRLIEQNEVRTLHALTVDRGLMEYRMDDHGGRIANTASDSV